MKAEKFLSRLSGLDRKIKFLELMLSKINEMKSALMPSGISYDGISVQVSPRDRFADEMAKIVDIESEIRDEIGTIAKGIEEVKDVVDKLDPVDREIVNCRFAQDCMWDETARAIGYSIRHTQRKYREMLDKVEEMLSDREIGGEE